MKPNINLQKNIPPLLRESWHGLNRTFMNRIKKVGLTPDQYTALRWLHSKPNSNFSQSKLAKLMSTDANNISDLIKRMVKRKLIKKETDLGDKRKKNIFPAPLGTEIYNRGKKIAQRLEEDALSCFTEIEQKEFKTLLHKLSTRIDLEKGK